MASSSGKETPAMLRNLFKRTRPQDLDRELAELQRARENLNPTSLFEREAIDLLIRSRARLRRRLGAGLPAGRPA
jgi:hypothetical protein